MFEYLWWKIINYQVMNNEVRLRYTQLPHVDCPRQWNKGKYTNSITNNELLMKSLKPWLCSCNCGWGLFFKTLVAVAFPFPFPFPLVVSKEVRRLQLGFMLCCTCVGCVFLKCYNFYFHFNFLNFYINSDENIT